MLSKILELPSASAALNYRMVVGRRPCNTVAIDDGDAKLASSSGLFGQQTSAGAGGAGTAGVSFAGSFSGIAGVALGGAERGLVTF